MDPRLSIFRLRQRSLARGVALSLAAFVASLGLAGFPHIEALHGSNWQGATTAAAALGMAETARCLERRWNLYHAGVLILLYTDLMIVGMTLVLWLLL